VELLVNFKSFLQSLPEVTKPEKKLTLKKKLMWTGVVLVLFFVLGSTTLYGLDPTYSQQFKTLEILLAAQFGSIITLGIGPIVTASIILQLLMGAEIIKMDTNTPEGRQVYQGVQKLFSIFFIIFENAAYVLSGALPGITNSFANTSILIIQLMLGGFLIMLLDEVTSKWGIGSGISLFIAAGVSKQIFVTAFSPIKEGGAFVGQIWQIVTLIIQGIPAAAIWPIIAIVATVIVFALAVYLQSIRVDIPLTWRVRGLGIRWPIKLLYTSNIPVILVAALIASMQFWGIMMYKSGFPILGEFEQVPTAGGGLQDQPKSGLVMYLSPPTIRDLIIEGFTSLQMTSIFVYFLFMTGGAIVFSVLWVKVGGMGPEKVADQIMSSGLSMPGFRRDPRIIELKLRQYIMPMAVVGGAAVGLLAASADLLGALSRGTGILLAVMIIYQFYEQLSRQHPEEFRPIVEFLSRRK
jgi:preprotein translocase subunit SecY